MWFNAKKKKVRDIILNSRTFITLSSRPKTQQLSPSFFYFKRLSRIYPSSVTQNRHGDNDVIGNNDIKMYFNLFYNMWLKIVPINNFINFVRSEQNARRLKIRVKVATIHNQTRV